MAFVPSIVLLISGLAASGYFIYQAVEARSFITKVHDAATPGAQFFAAVQAERQLTLTNLATHGGVATQLAPARAATNATAARMATVLGGLVDQAPDRVKTAVAAIAVNVAKLPSVRQQADAGQIGLLDAYGFYNQIIDEYTDGLLGVAERAPDTESGYLRVTAMPLFVSADAMARSDALASAGLAGGGLTGDELRTYVAVVGAYHAGFDGQVREMIPSVKRQYDALRAGPAWATVTAVENSILSGNRSTLPVAQQQWRDASTQVGGALMNLYVQQSSNATQVEIDTGNRQLITSIAAGVAALLLSVLVAVIARRMAGRLVRRLVRLREETLEIADTQLPDLVNRVRKGEDVDLEVEMSVLDHGEDEIGQVADAFNKAQRTAVAAAVDEAKTREGTQKVFLDIAHRSQILVHRQLRVLDEAERKQADPDHLDLLFKLDHLSTRARRNAENLIILGGERPGRQWRNPVALADLVSGVTAETEDYTRVNIAPLPAIAVSGPAVADVIHLIAELIDNATNFSPPKSRVDLSATLAARGLVIEIEDQGLGMEPEQLEQLNEMLQDPPDFSVMALSAEPRLGMFVVARLAARHNIAVTLRVSAYGGTRAIVLIRSDLLVPLPTPEERVELPPSAVPVQPMPLAEERVRAAPAYEDSPTKVDLFSPTPPRGQPALSQSKPSAPPPVAATQGPPTQGPLSPGRPRLPRRERQRSLVPQLRQAPAPAGENGFPTDDPDRARSRFGAFQQGSRQARDTDPATEMFRE
ncbi:sensor histidine kinase [Amycolatopsis pigmentata]|uniref:histidine kinase n=1 Tax=Amycolatopsis pigmentata TaxID=450801 RepID=A0ABW5FP72_9PSEU